MVSCRFRSGAVALASLAALAAPSAAGAAVILSAPDNGGCGKAGCLTSGRYEQTFSALSFAGPVTIAGLRLDRGILGELAGRTFKLSFALADGTAVGSWGSWTMGGLGGDSWTIDGSDFDWDLALGDLVLRLELVRFDGGGVGGGFGGGFRAAPNEGGPNGGPNGGGGGDAPFFPNSPVVDAISAPEPSTWAMMIIGFGGAGALLRRRNQLRLI